MMHNNEKATNSDEEVMAVASQTAENSLEPSNDKEPAKSDNKQSSKTQKLCKKDAPIEKGPYGDIAILTLDSDFLVSLGINPENVDELQYQSYKGAVLIEPITQ